jgi:molybdate/tungstate transport system substrate-binding protein
MRKETHRTGHVLLLLACLLATAPGCKRQQENETKTLAVFHAGSLAIPFREVSRLFEKRHPGVRVQAEAAGSRDTARKVSDLGRKCDVLGSADYRVVENLLMPEHASFNIQFATNEMTIAYTKKSRRGQEITANNWHEILLDPKVAFGRSDPNRDPCGYRTVMLFQLAEAHLGLTGLAKKLQQKDGQRFIRPKETDLLALLESGQIDYMFIYRSVAKQHQLATVQLPAEIHLGSPDMADTYKHARVSVTGKKPGQHLTRVGAPIAYSVTMPKNGARPELATAYLELLLSPEGQAIMDRNGQRPITPVRARGPVPARLQRHLKSGTNAP